MVCIVYKIVFTDNQARIFIVKLACLGRFACEWVQAKWAGFVGKRVQAKRAAFVCEQLQAKGAVFVGKRVWAKGPKSVAEQVRANWAAFVGERSKRGEGREQGYQFS